MQKRRAKTQTAPGKKKSRTRSGCFTCRDRHMKCDEQLPVCQNCINGKRKCYRGVRLNFTSYTFYNPHEDSALPEEFNHRRSFRILDQSIAISSLYKDGASYYRKNLKLHSAHDLAEAEFCLRQDLIAHKSMPLQVSSSAHSVSNTVDPEIAFARGVITSPTLEDEWTSDKMLLSLSDSVILENYDIKNFLMNPPQIPVPPEPDRSTSRTPVSPIHFSTETSLKSDIMDTSAVVSALQTQNCCWFLDLFNDISVWKSVVPGYCVRLNQLLVDRNPSFLLDCLLGCEKHTSDERILHNAHEQLEQWYPFEMNDITSANFQEFEQALLSIVLVTFSVLLRATKPAFEFSTPFQIVLANQGLLLHKAASRFRRMPPLLLKRLPNMVLIVASFQAMVILRFFMKKHIRVSAPGYIFPQIDPRKDPLEEKNSFEQPQLLKLGYFFTPTPFEIANLNEDFRNFDLPREKSEYISDAGKLRQVMWNLVKIELTFDGFLMTMGTDSSPMTIPEKGSYNTSTLVPSEQCIAIHLLSGQFEKLTRNPALDSSQINAILREIFDKINSSTMSNDLKAKWQTHFGWNLDCNI